MSRFFNNQLVLWMAIVLSACAFIAYAVALVSVPGGRQSNLQRCLDLRAEGFTQLRDKNYGASEQCYKQAIACADSMSSSDLRMESERELADVYTAEGNYGLAADALRSVIGWYNQREAGAFDQEQRITAQLHLAQVLAHSDNPTQAKQEFEELLSEKNVVYVSPAKRMQAMQEYAVVLKKLGLKAQSLSAEVGAEAIRDDLGIFDNHFQAAQAAIKADNLDEAEKHLRIDITLGTNHKSFQQIVSSKWCMAVQLLKQRNYAEAEKILAPSRDLFLSTKFAAQKKDPTVSGVQSDCLSMLAYCRYVNNEPEDAALLKQAFAFSSNTLSAEGDWPVEVRNYWNAKSWTKDSIKLTPWLIKEITKYKGEHADDLALMFISYGEDLYVMNKKAEANTYFLRAKQRLAAMIGDPRLDEDATTRWTHLEACVCIRLGDRISAVAIDSRLVSKLGNSAKDTAMKANILTFLADWCSDTPAEQMKAAAYLRQAIQLWERLPEPSRGDDYTAALLNLAKRDAKLGQTADMRRNYDKAIAMSKASGQTLAAARLQFELDKALALPNDAKLLADLANFVKLLPKADEQFSGNPQEQAFNWTLVADNYTNSYHPKEAAPCYRQAFKFIKMMKNDAPIVAVFKKHCPPQLQQQFAVESGASNAGQTGPQARPSQSSQGSLNTL